MSYLSKKNVFFFDRSYMSESAAASVPGFEKAHRCYTLALAALDDSDPGLKRQVEAEAANTQLNLGTALLHASSSAANKDGTGA